MDVEKHALRALLRAYMVVLRGQYPDVFRHVTAQLLAEPEEWLDEHSPALPQTGTAPLTTPAMFSVPLVPHPKPPASAPM